MAKLANTEHAVKCIFHMVTWRICTCISRMPPLGSLLGPSPSLQPIPVTAGIPSPIQPCVAQKSSAKATVSCPRRLALTVHQFGVDVVCCLISPSCFHPDSLYCRTLRGCSPILRDWFPTDCQWRRICCMQSLTIWSGLVRPDHLPAKISQAFDPRIPEGLGPTAPAFVLTFCLLTAACLPGWHSAVYTDSILGLAVWLCRLDSGGFCFGREPMLC